MILQNKRLYQPSRTEVTAETQITSPDDYLEMTMSQLTEPSA